MNRPDLPDDHDLSHLREALNYFDGRRLAVDGGAHRGIWTREMAKHFESVIAYEPRLELAMKIDCGEVFSGFALGEDYGWCDIADGPDNNGQGFVVPGNLFQVVPLDAFHLENLDFLKLDVEGYELHALRGASVTILRYRPAIMVEMNGLSERYGYSDSDIGLWLSDRGYTHVARFNKDHLYL